MKNQSNREDDVIRALIDHYNFKRLPVEGTFYTHTYRAEKKSEGIPCSSGMIGMYCEEPLSVSCFHRLSHDEMWHFYGGDPLELILLYPNGTSEVVTMGSDPLKGQKVQYLVPAGTWQAGSVVKGGHYALYGCTVTPGFIGSCFEAGLVENLIKAYPDREADIRRLSVNDHETHMPEDFQD